MRYELRRATVGDAAAIAGVISESFGESADPAQVARRLQSQTEHTLVVCLKHRPVAFADCFPTLSATGERRLELDLLAVSQAARGRGIAGQLVAECLQLARESKADLLRALVSLDNAPMNRAFDSLGFVAETEAALLYTKSAVASDGFTSGVQGAHFVRVDTLTYSGIWIEGQISADAIAESQRLACHEDRSIVGALVAISDVAARSLLESAGFRVMGSYRWRTLRIESG